MEAAQPPLMQMAGGAVLLAGALGYVRRDFMDGLNGILLCLGAVLLSGANIFGLIPLVAVTTGLVVLGVWRKVRLPFAGKLILFSTFAIMSVLGLYYASTLLRATGGAQLWNVSPANVLFVAYEFFGFQGLGPGRQELREIIKCLVPAGKMLPFLPGLLILATAYLTLLGTAYKSWLTRDVCPPPGAPLQAGASVASELLPCPRRYSLVHAWLMGVGVTLLSAFFLFLLAYVSGFSFWGRHLAGAFPFCVLALAVTLRWAGQGLWRKAGRMVMCGLFALLLISSLSVRFSPNHGHDDYRGAAAEALRISATGRSVWWVADHSGGVYYGLPFEEGAVYGPGKIVFAMNRPEIPPQSPDVIIVSRLDNFDTHGTASRLVAKGGYKKVLRLQAFTVWEK